MSDDVDEVIWEFLVESYEGLDRLDADLVDLETDPTDPDIVASIFRTMHTIKGTCGFLGFPRLEAVAHAGENLLGRLRDRSLVADRQIIDALLATADAVRGQLRGIERDGVEPDDEHAALRTLLGRLQEGGGAAQPAELLPFGSHELARREAERALAAPAAEQTGPAPVAAMRAAAPPMTDAPAAVSARADVPTAAPVPVPAAAPAAAEPEAERSSGGIADTSVRVDVELLDRLMDLMGELVLARNQIVRTSQQQLDGSLLAPAQRLNHVTSELQASVMKTRLQPIGSVANRLPRVVRDLATACGKQARMQIEGAETELDRSLLEAIKDPLVHLVRNAVDHGLEAPDDRVRAGKPAQGTLVLRAHHQRGKVLIELVDDGRGIAPAKVRDTAIARGVVTAAEAAALSDEDAVALVFRPGFSTASTVTNISGRGVGMDVVRTNIEKVGGQIELRSEPGRGTAVRIEIPLTLAIIPALVLRCGTQRFALPQVQLCELLRLDAADRRRGVELVHGAPVFRRYGRLVPLIGLGDLLAGGTGTALGEPTRGGWNVLVAQANDHRFGLVVDDVVESQEIVVKPLSSLAHGADVFAGAAVLGDGTIALIIDASGIARRAGLDLRRPVAGPASGAGDAPGAPTGSGASAGSATASTAATAATGTADVPGERHALVVVDAGGRRAAVALEDVVRLEHVRADRIERAATGRVVQHRGTVLPLVDLRDALPGPPAHPDGDEDALPRAVASVLILRAAGREIGVAVDVIVDVVDAAVDHVPGHGYVAGTAVVHGRVTDVVDAAGFVGHRLGHGRPTAPVPQAGVR
jgi:two-component system chemotaxis sensor kinase CheA